MVDLLPVLRPVSVVTSMLVGNQMGFPALSSPQFRLVFCIPAISIQLQSVRHLLIQCAHLVEAATLREPTSTASSERLLIATDERSFGPSSSATK